MSRNGHGPQVDAVEANGTCCLMSIPRTLRNSVVVAERALFCQLSFNAPLFHYAKQLFAILMYTLHRSPLTLLVLFVVVKNNSAYHELVCSVSPCAYGLLSDSTRQQRIMSRSARAIIVFGKSSNDKWLHVSPLD